MITMPPAVSVMLQMFGLLFSNRWLDQWQQSPLGPVEKKRPCAAFTSASTRCGSRCGI